MSCCQQDLRLGCCRLLLMLGRGARRCGRKGVLGRGKEALLVLHDGWTRWQGLPELRSGDTEPEVELSAVPACQLL